MIAANPYVTPVKRSPIPFLINMHNPRVYRDIERKNLEARIGEARAITDSRGYERFGDTESLGIATALWHKNMETVEALGGTPFIPFTLRNVEPKDDGIWAKMYHLFHYRREEFLEHYHQRSAVETVFSKIKGKFGASVRSKSEWGQVNEVLAKVLCHNICVLIRAMDELGIEPTFLD